MRARSAPSIASLLAESRALLRSAAGEISPREALLLLGSVLGRTEAYLLAHGEDPVPEELAERLRRIVVQRCAGVPAAHLLGQREFFGRPFLVDHRVLVPRPETEHLVERSLELSLPARPRVVDLGTGSGCLAITLALELRDARVIAVDRSTAALTVARRNAVRLGASVGWVRGDWCRALAVSSFDLLVANPPYLALRDLATIPCDVRDHEPSEALFAGEDGLSAYRSLLASVPPVDGAVLLLELGAGLRPAVATLAEAAGWLVAGIGRDLAGIERVLELRPKGR